MLVPDSPGVTAPSKSHVMLVYCIGINPSFVVAAYSLNDVHVCAASLREGE